MPLFITEPEFDENCSEKLARHGLDEERVLQLLEEAPKFFQQTNGRLRVIGPDYTGRIITAVVEYPDDRGRAYVVTGWVADKDERARYRHPGGLTNG